MVKNRQRRCVANRVMKIQNQHVVAAAEPNELRAHQRRFAEVIGLMRVLICQAFHCRRGLVRRALGQIEYRQSERRRGEDLLRRFAVDLDQGGAQTLMTLDQLSERLFKGRNLQESMDTVDRRHIVRRESGFELV